MILYGSSLSPFARKVLAYAGEKGIEIELQPTGFPNPSAEFLEASPFRKMPALRDGDYMLADSSAIVHYIEAKHPEPALIPADAKLRGKTITRDCQFMALAIKNRDLALKIRAHRNHFPLEFCALRGVLLGSLIALLYGGVKLLRELLDLCFVIAANPRKLR